MRNQRIDWPTELYRNDDPTKWMRERGLGLLEQSSLLSDRDDRQLELGLSPDMLTEIKRAVFVNQGWRLTKVGLRLFANNYNVYRSTHDENLVMVGKVLVSMDDAVGGPWGYRDKEIFVFDSQVHFELQMCDGSAKRFIEFKKTG